MENKSINKFVYLVFGIVLGYLLFNFVSQRGLSKDAKKFNEIIQLTKEYYLTDTKEENLFESAINGMFEELDPHSSYLSADFQKNAQEDLRGDFEGIGIEFQILRDTINVVSAIANGPSDKLGIIPGDRIISVDNKNVIKIPSEKVIKLLRGEKGTTVEVKIFRPSNKKILNYTIVRDKIPIFSVDSYFMIDKEVGYISVSKFSETTTNEILKALYDLKSHGMKKLVFDLRGNPGGLLSQAFQVADLFISDNKLIVSTKGRKSEFDEEYKASYNSPFEDIPLILLINHGSASASEIVAGAIQDWDRGVILGQTSFGKGLVQRPFILDDGSAIRLTVAKYYTPSGRAIQRKYTNDRKEYYLESVNDSSREKEIKNEKKYKTHNGRIVYENGGITPDIKIENDMISDFYVELRKENVFYEFVRYAIDKNLVQINKELFPNVDSFKNKFQIDKKLSYEFTKFIQSKKIKFDSDKYLKDKLNIDNRLKAHFARELFNNDGWYSVLIENDNYVKKSISIFSNYKDYLK
ncbi:MAG: S41 family peptidase [Ignavibacteriales bacterium]